MALPRTASCTRRSSAQAPLVVNDVEQARRQHSDARGTAGTRHPRVRDPAARGERRGDSASWACIRRQPNSFDAAELGLLHEIAGDIAFGLDHIRKEEQITLLAYYDSLTGLANRSLFHDRLTAMLRVAEREGQTIALCVADLDHFKNFNDALGRENGDLLLVEFGKRLVSCANTPEQVARLGSDRFVIALPARAGSRAPPPQRIEAHLDRCTAQPFRIAGSEVHIAARFGISLLSAGRHRRGCAVPKRRGGAQERQSRRRARAVLHAAHDRAGRRAGGAGEPPAAARSKGRIRAVLPAEGRRGHLCGDRRRGSAALAGSARGSRASGGHSCRCSRKPA